MMADERLSSFIEKRMVEVSLDICEASFMGIVYATILLKLDKAPPAKFASLYDQLSRFSQCVMQIEETIEDCGLTECQQRLEWLKARMATLIERLLEYGEKRGFWSDE